MENISGWLKCLKDADYDLLPQEVADDPTLSALSKLLFASILSLLSLSGNDEAYCVASNEYLGMLHGVSERTAGRHLRELIDNGLIRCEYDNKPRRKIFVPKKYLLEIVKHFEEWALL